MSIHLHAHPRDRIFADHRGSHPLDYAALPSRNFEVTPTRGRCDKLGPASDGNSGICSSLFSLLRELGGLCPVATGGFVRFPNECECIGLVRHQNRQRHPRKQFTRDAANEFLPKLGIPKGPGDDLIGANSVRFALYDNGNRLAADVFQT